MFIALTVALLATAVPVAAHGRGPGASSLPTQIDLPPGFQPEGITAGRGQTFYVGSLANGAIVRGNFRTGAVEPFVAGIAGEVAVGTHFEARRNRLWVAGGATHEVRVYHGTTGALLMTYTLPGGFLNDLISTPTAIYVTDSNNSQLGVIPLGRGGALPPQSAVFVRPLTGITSIANQFNVNGIAWTGRWLLLVQSNTGLLFRVDPRTGVATQIDLGGQSVANGDGLEVRGRTIYVVRNQNNLVAVFRANGAFTEADHIRNLTGPGPLAVPTTAVVKGNAVWVVNARFGTPPTPTTAYWVSRLAANP
jgi:sugar lactone lactonase YvrE